MKPYGLLVAYQAVQFLRQLSHREQEVLNSRLERLAQDPHAGVDEIVRDMSGEITTSICAEISPSSTGSIPLSER
jgi:hypothetical protein